ncbi:probable 3-deoxy-D-manno-octulosonic acid transferase, mitochondrial isoform X1 [Coffea arabica]|uniref:Probable 3-deoxy-D-manno-octulosonic acid transferase, mitochondrial isoform X1 n=1 Tax=Coffea arabica TaxID=13443 RepID=A0ABM4UM58_COFAR|nr:probable 3-deoxy-D-manno-octulosonic acid transferase, mitochondrial isoform X1 [Coffea arabica]
MARGKGELIYKIYRAFSYGLSPLINLHLRWRKFRGLEHPKRWTERLGRPSLPRPAGPLVWFHAVSLGEGMAAIPVIKCCLTRRPDVTVLMTSTTLSAFEVIKKKLPANVIYQFAPVDAPAAVEAFLGYWKPNAIILIESELWPNLIISAAKDGIALALLNARISAKSFRYWSLPVVLPLAAFMLSKFSLIVPLSNQQAIQFQLLQAPPLVINFSGDLKYAVEDTTLAGDNGLEELQEQLKHRKVWMASSLHRGEDKILLRVHKALKEIYPDMLTIIVPRHLEVGQEIVLELQRKGISVALRSRSDKLSLGTETYVVDTLGELRELYRLTPIAVIGGSFLPGLAGHNISEAAVAGCAVLTGHYLGHFNHMVQEMQRLNPSSVLQVSGDMLVEALIELFSDAKLLETRRAAAKQAYHALSIGVVENMWRLVQFHILDKSVPM